MHENLCNFIYDELDELDRKVKNGGKLSNAELEYADTLAHLKKSLLTVDAMKGGYSERGYSYNYPRYAYDRDRWHDDGYSEARRRDARGRYSGADEHERMVMELREAMAAAKDPAVREDIKRLIEKVERM